MDALVRSGVWQVLWPGVLMDAGFVPSPGHRAWGAVLASGGGPHPGTAVQSADQPRGVFACGRTAARLWQLPLVDDDDPATGAREHLLDDVAVPGNRGGSLTWRGRSLSRHQLVLRRGDVVRTRSGLLVTSALRTLVDCASLLRQDALVCCLDDGLHRGLVTTGRLDDAVRCRKGRRGGPALKAAVEAADARAEAPSETLLRLVLRPHFPRLEPQVQLFDDAARLLARFDLADRDARVAVEADGVQAHSGPAMVAKDRRRDRAARQRGWVTERFTWYDLRRRGPEVVVRTREAYADQQSRRAA